MNFLDKVLGEKVREEDKIVWSSELVNRAKLAIEDGVELNMNPFYEKDINYKKPNILYEYTDEEIEEVRKCASDVVYFANKYAFTMTDEGIKQIVLRDYQVDTLNNFQTNRFSILKSSRQIGKTILSSIFLSWYTLFNFDRNALIVANKGETTKELMEKIKTVIENLPFFLKPGMVKKDVMGMKFDNGCRILGQTTTKSAAIGFTVHLLYCDEFAHIPPNIIEPFWRSVYPTLSSSKISRCIITSTPNGFNKFYDIYKAGEEKENEFLAIDIPYWKVPGRDEAWKQREIANLGSLEMFNQEYACLFLSSSNLLLSSDTMKYLADTKVKYEFKELLDLEDCGFEKADYESLTFHPDFDINELKDEDDFFVWSVDASEGVGGDSNLLTLFKLKLMSIEEIKKLKKLDSDNELVKITQVGTLKTNTLPPDKFAKLLYHLAVDVHNTENLKIVIEANTFGGEVIRQLLNIYDDDNEFESEMLVKFSHRKESKTKNFGIKIGSDKAIYCNDAKRSIENGILEFNDERHVKSFETFVRNENTGSYEAITGHDDEAMTIVNISQIFKTIDWSELVEEFLNFREEEVEEIKEKFDFKKSKKDIKEDEFDEYDFLN